VEHGVELGGPASRQYSAAQVRWRRKNLAGRLSGEEDGVYFLFYSDPFDNVRYFGQLKFPVSKGAFPPAETMMKTIAEVVTDDSAQEAAPADSSAPPAQQAAGGQAPAAATKTITLGQTEDDVVGILGPPQKKVNLGTKEIYFYPDMKVVFISGKVADVQ
jgi:hypothetical protein